MSNHKVCPMCDDHRILIPLEQAMCMTCEQRLRLTCLDDNKSECEGPVEYRMALSDTGQSFPRCDKHWGERLEEQERINERYPVNPPSDWSPLDAGEHWGEEDY